MRKLQTHRPSDKKDNPEGTLCGRVATLSRIFDRTQATVTCKTCAWMYAQKVYEENHGRIG